MSFSSSLRDSVGVFVGSSSGGFGRWRLNKKGNEVRFSLQTVSGLTVIKNRLKVTKRKVVFVTRYFEQGQPHRFAIYKGKRIR